MHNMASLDLTCLVNTSNLVRTTLNFCLWSPKLLNRYNSINNSINNEHLKKSKDIATLKKR